MDCQTTRRLIDMHPEGVSGGESAEWSSVEQHLAECPLCQNAAAEIHEWDSRLRSAMVEVPVPEGVRERILAQLSKSAPTVAGELVERMPAGRSLKWSLSGLSLALAVIAGVWFWTSSPAQVPMASLNQAVGILRTHPSTELPLFDGSFTAAIQDSKWRGVCEPQPVGLDLDGRPGHDAAAFRVNFPSLRFRGWLVVVPLSRIADAPDSQIPVLMGYDQTACWRDDKYIFVCIAEPGSPIKRLVDQWGGAAA